MARETSLEAVEQQRKTQPLERGGEGGAKNATPKTLAAGRAVNVGVGICQSGLHSSECAHAGGSTRTGHCLGGCQQLDPPRLPAAHTHTKLQPMVHIMWAHWARAGF